MTPLTLVVTSCNRHDLLERTLASFCKFNKYPITETIVIEDGPAHQPRFLSQLQLGKITWLTNAKREGQIYSIDKAYSQVKTPYIFHTEDDWEFVQSGFIEKSMDILDERPEILQVWLREDSAHPIVQTDRYPFKTMQLEWRDGWSGFAFNPGLRRTLDYRLIGTYGKHVGYDPRFVGELYLSRLYKKLGYEAAALTPAFCKHIGGNRHIQWMTEQPKKVLVAIPVCHNHSYGSYNNQFHNDKQSPRIQALRETWLRDIASFDSYVEYKFFYGKGANRDPFPDEVFLNCDDSYETLPHKVKELMKWAFNRGFEYVYKCDDDTYCYIDRLLSSDFRQHDQVGFSPCFLQREPGNANYIVGGPGYTLNRRAMEAVATGTVSHKAEDLWVGREMIKRRYDRFVDLRFLPGFDAHYVDICKLPVGHNYISLHSVRPEDMYSLYQQTEAPQPELREKHRPKAIASAA